MVKIMYYIYMIRCSDNSIYTGITTDVERRFKEHTGKIPGKAAKYTGSRRALSIEAVWQCDSREKASRLEFYIKKLIKYKKEQLIKDNTFFVKFFAEKVNCEEYERVK